MRGTYWRGRGRGAPPPRALVRATHPAAGDVADAYFVRDGRSLRRIGPPALPHAATAAAARDGFVRTGRSLRRVAPAASAASAPSTAGLAPTVQPALPVGAGGMPAGYVRAGRSLRRVAGEAMAPSGYVRSGNSLRRAEIPLPLKPAQTVLGKHGCRRGGTVHRTLVRGRNRRLDRRRAQHCLFFSRFGRCTQAESTAGCPFIHDPAAVGVCRAWLVGRCEKAAAECTLEHAVDRDKMPACERFLQGRCARPRGVCPYLHVSHAGGTPLCEPFALRGFCVKGQACDRVHTWNCLEFVRTGACGTRETCRLRHWSLKRRERAQNEVLQEEEEEEEEEGESGSDLDDGEETDGSGHEDVARPDGLVLPADFITL